jgi:hypothetical protein
VARKNSRVSARNEGAKAAIVIEVE